MNNNLLKVKNANDLISDWYKDVEKMVAHRGVDDTIKRVKLARLCVTRYICGQPMKTTGNISVAVRKNGLPNLIGARLRLLAKGTENDRRLLLTMLCVSRALPGSPYTPPLATITDCSQIDNSVKAELGFLIPMVMQQMGLSSSSAPKWREYHLTTKAGPNAVALVSALLEARVLPNDLIEHIRVVGGAELIKNLELIKDLNPEKIAERFKVKNFKEKTLRIRKLSLVNAPERKSRIIAILDYWSQSALKPLHDRVFSILKGLEGDCTFNQHGPQKFLSSGPYSSLDLTAATDRFPIEIQKIVLATLVGNEKYANSWASILIDYPFFVPWDNSDVKYNAGQPMGAYSSWAVFALTHHVIVRVAAMKVGLSYFTNYALLGDDIVIGNDNVARSYKEIMKGLGVSISEMKSHESVDTYEFAKRWYHKGINITGAQTNAFISGKKWFLAANEYKNLCNLWSINDYEAEPGVLGSLYKALAHRPEMISRLAKRAIAFLCLPWDRPGISREDQALRFIQNAAPQVLGCHSMAKDRAMNFFKVSLAEVKARVLEAGILKTIGIAKETIKDLKSIHNDYEGLDSQSILKAVPSIMITAKQYSTLMSDIDALRDPLETTPEKLIFNEVRVLGFDASRINTTRDTTLLMATNATLVNQYMRWLRDYFDLTNKVLSDELMDLNAERAIARKLFRTKVIGTVMPGFPLSGGKETS